MMFDDKQDPKLRFEAKRKLLLMDMAATIDQKERETNFEGKFNTFQTFLNEYVWSDEKKTAESVPIYLVSNHRKEDTFEVTGDVIVLTQNEGGYTKRNLDKRKLL
jgi:hypothetical protein